MKVSKGLFKSMALSLVVLGVLVLSTSCAKEAAVKSKDGVSINYMHQGKGDLALVFVHGWSCDATYWQDQINYFSPKHQVVAIDMAGHGKSGQNRKEYTIDSFGNDVAAVVNTLKAKKVILIGHSMGGAVIVNAHKKIDKKIKVLGLVGADTFHANRNFSPKEQEGFLKAFEGDFKTGAQNFVRAMFPKGADKNIVSRIVQDMSSAPEEVAMSSMRNYLKYNHKRAMRGVRTALVAINADLWPTDIDAVKKSIPGFTVKFMKGVGHFIAQERPKEFNMLLEEYVKELDK